MAVLIISHRPVELCLYKQRLATSRQKSILRCAQRQQTLFLQQHCAYLRTLAALYVRLAIILATPHTCDSHQAMLARYHTMNTRAVHDAILRPFHASRPLRAITGRPWYAVAARAFHEATAEFINLGPEGTLVTKEISIHVGNPEEAYVCIPTEVGYALQATGSRLANSLSALPKRPDRFALSYFHDTQHFALESSPGCPRLVIPQQLPRQSAANTSPATLYLYGLIHTIALDGTPDAEFAELASTIIPDIGEALDKLKDM